MRWTAEFVTEASTWAAFDPLRNLVVTRRLITAISPYLCLVCRKTARLPDRQLTRQAAELLGRLYLYRELSPIVIVKGM
jgi:hypothetical protein